MRRALLLMTSLALSLFVAEYFLRRMGAVEYRRLPPSSRGNVQGGGLRSHQASAVPGLDYELTPDLFKRWRGLPIDVNSYGMRDSEPRPDADGLVRIAVIGDSFTFGWGVMAEVAYPNALERLLNEDAAPGVEFDVLNFGVSGYSSRDEAVVLEHKVRPWKPNLVIVGYVLNDIENVPREPLPGAFAPTEWWRHSHLLRLLAQARWEWDVRRLGGGDYHRYLYADAERWDGLVEAFGSIRRIAEEMETPVLLVLFPRIPPPHGSWDDYSYGDIHQRVTELARQNDFAVLDLYPRYSLRPPSKFGVTHLDRHPNWYGHYLAARAIEYRLRHQLRQQMIPRSVSRPETASTG